MPSSRIHPIHEEYSPCDRRISLAVAAFFLRLAGLKSRLFFR